ncbi:SPOR domain-containing protein [Bacteroides ihuae]|uniref:SPOR domain-containing protein n=1 Tax=Bacteroides ihuae TaxID=1852362 RepID=UPI0008DAE689|nr:SPOR domain-containing protein [Bacteroides ihuae]
MKTYSFYSALLFLLFAFSVAKAQNIVKSLERDVPGQGKVTVHQDSRLEALLGQEHTSNAITGSEEQEFIKVAGYRVQVYAGNNSRSARSEAQNIGFKVKEYFPDLKVYTTFSSPRWLCRVGDFRSIEEADAALRQLKATGVFREVSIVKEQVNIPL